MIAIQIVGGETIFSVSEYSQNILDNQEKFEDKMIASTIFSLFINLSRCIEDNYHNKFKSGRKMIDSKLRRIIQEKKIRLLELSRRMVRRKNIKISVSDLE